MWELLSVENVIALVTLTGLEIVLGIDNIVFISVLVGKLPPHQQASARQTGLALAMIMRVALLFAISWVTGLTRELFALPSFWTADPADHHVVSGRDLVLAAGGLFLIGKATYEIHDKLEGEAAEGAARTGPSLRAIITQIVLLDIVFSLDSVITAVGMVATRVEARWVGLAIMIVAVVLAVIVMLAFAGGISAFVERHPTMKMLALSFLILIGVTLVAEGFHVDIPRGYIYFAMAFSLAVELLNMRWRKISSPVRLQQSYVKP